MSDRGTKAVEDAARRRRALGLMPWTPPPPPDSMSSEALSVWRMWQRHDQEWRTWVADREAERRASELQKWRLMGITFGLLVALACGVALGLAIAVVR